jgi:hypothetical protein
MIQSSHASVVPGLAVAQQIDGGKAQNRKALKKHLVLCPINL